ncbi:putative 52 kDa repressor of the inhibitor of the protein kinase-like [Ditylenchus destructor]|uniref:52 kDa repressor of the inhibitor of the protein kinase-like n=1 Tax=Ditylenchus destructor TaxID=166010 RepID=A0AAD4NGP5_9BILA|nr:putative 52 kDa repressor of the inhibitor of the protein kinase-like [Ditylenchus destructor]
MSICYSAKSGNYQGELTFDGAIKFCNKAHFPIIYDLLKIFGITPVTTDIAERSFSSLKLLKTYLRNRTKEERLSSMALAYINQDVAIESSDIAEFFIQKNRRLDFGSEKDDEKTEFVENIEL